MDFSNWEGWLQGAVIVTGVVQLVKDFVTLLLKDIKVIDATKEKELRWLWPLALIIMGLIVGYSYDSTKWLWYGLGYMASALIFREVIIELPKALVARVRGTNK